MANEYSIQKIMISFSNWHIFNLKKITKDNGYPTCDRICGW